MQSAPRARDADPSLLRVRRANWLRIDCELAKKGLQSRDVGARVVVERHLGGDDVLVTVRDNGRGDICALWRAVDVHIGNGEILSLSCTNESPALSTHWTELLSELEYPRANRSQHLIGKVRHLVRAILESAAGPCGNGA